jgi:hypothetical protein
MMNPLVAASATRSLWPTVMPHVSASASLNGQKISDSLPSVLQKGTWYINGKDGGMGFEMKAPLDGDMLAPIVVYIPGAGVLNQKMGNQTYNTPSPSWSVILNVPGIHRFRTPDCHIEALAFLRRVTETSRNYIVVIGFSRGAAWVVDICKEDVDKCDAAIALAPYPWTKCAFQNAAEAKTLMSVQAPLLLVHFHVDEFCNAVFYPTWYATFALGMVTNPDDTAVTSYGQRSKTFVSAVCQGKHAQANALFYSLDFQDLSEEGPHVFWQSMWKAFSNRRLVHLPG